MRKLLYMSVVLVALSLPAHAQIERVYVQMPIMPNNPIYTWEAYRTRHLEVTGHKIPAKASQNTQGTHYLSGEVAAHLIQEHQDTLKAEFNMVLYTDGWPNGWVNKEPPEQ